MEHKFVGVGLYTGYVESASVAGTFIACQEGIFYKDPIKLLKNVAYCFSAAYITECEQMRKDELRYPSGYTWNEKWIEDRGRRYEHFMDYISNILTGTISDSGEAHNFLFEKGPFDMYKSFSVPGDWLIVYEQSEYILAALAFGEEKIFNYPTNFGVTTVSEHKEITVNI